VSSLVTVVRSHHGAWPLSISKLEHKNRTRAVVHGPGHLASVEPKCKSRPRAVVHVMERFSEAKEQDLSIFLHDNSTGMDETLDPARNGRNRSRWPESPVSWLVRDIVSSIPVCMAVRGIPSILGGTETKLTTMGGSRFDHQTLHSIPSTCALHRERGNSERGTESLSSTASRRLLPLR
jgi:hypothetical protein